MLQTFSSNPLEKYFEKLRQDYFNNVQKVLELTNTQKASLLLSFNFFFLIGIRSIQG